MSEERSRRHAEAVSAASYRAARGNAARPALGSKVFSAEKLLLARMMESLGNPPLDLLLWDGQAITSASGPPLAQVVIRDRGALLKLIAHPELGFGEMYAAERIDVQGDLVGCLEAIYRSMRGAGHGQIAQKLLAPFNASQRNTETRARRNIHHHYDIGNDFYK